MFDVKTVKYIRSDLQLRGHTQPEQDKGDCARRIIQFWTDDGILVFEHDPYLHKTEVFREDLI